MSLFIWGWGVTVFSGNSVHNIHRCNQASVKTKSRSLNNHSARTKQCICYVLVCVSVNEYILASYRKATFWTIFVLPCNSIYFFFQLTNKDWAVLRYSIVLCAVDNCWLQQHRVSALSEVSAQAQVCNTLVCCADDTSVILSQFKSYGRVCARVSVNGTSQTGIWRVKRRRRRGQWRKDVRLWHRLAHPCLPGQPTTAPQAARFCPTRTTHTVCQTSLPLTEPPSSADMGRRKVTVTIHCSSQQILKEMISCLINHLTSFPSGNSFK